MNALDAAWRPHPATGLPRSATARGRPLRARRVTPGAADGDTRLHVLDAVAGIPATVVDVSLYGAGIAAGCGRGEGAAATRCP